MIHQFADGGGAEKGRNEDREELVIGSEVTHSDLLEGSDEIDPGEFFDPEEFGVRRKAEPWRHE